MLFLPLAVTNRWQDVDIIRVELFTKYTDKEFEPMVGFRGILESQYGGSLPTISRACIHLSRQIGETANRSVLSATCFLRVAELMELSTVTSKCHLMIFDWKGVYRLMQFSM